MEDVRDGSLFELLSANYFILCGESVEGMMEKYDKRKAAVEEKGLRVSIGRTKTMHLLEEQNRVSVKIDSVMCVKKE